MKRVTEVCLLGCLVTALAVGCSATRTVQSEAPPSEDGTSAAVEPADAPNATGGGVRYLAIGDSLTQGVGAPDEATGAFPALLAEHWREDGCDVELQNVGISGYTAGQILDEQVPQIESFKPTIITFQAGGNDIANGIPIDAYRDDVNNVLESATGSGARVIVLAQNDWARSPMGIDYGESLPSQRVAYDDVLIEEASAHGAEFVDMRALYSEQADQNMWVEDGIHPTPEAYRAWADQLSELVPAPCNA